MDCDSEFRTDRIDCCLLDGRARVHVSAVKLRRWARRGYRRGGTEDEALENIQDAIREYLEATVKISKGAKMREVEVPVYSYRNCQA
jgi:hypothetical protein